MHAPSQTNRIVFLILFAALILRLYGISSESLWVDEAQTLGTTQLNPAELIQASAQDNHPPFYTLFLHVWIKIAGDSEFSLRLPSAIFSAAAVWLIYLIAVMVSDPKTAVYPAVMAALSYFFIQYAQEVRSYSLALVSSLLSIYILLRLLRKMKFTDSVLYLVANTLLIYTHYLGFFIILVQLIYILYLHYFRQQHRIRLSLFFMIYVLILVLYLPWINILMSRISDVQREYWVDLPDIYTIPETLLVYTGTYTPYGILLLIILSGAILYSVIFAKTDTLKRNGFLVWSGFILPVALPLIISLIWSPFYIIRITIAAAAFFYILAGSAIGGINNKVLRHTILLVTIVCSAANLLIYYGESHKERWPDASAYIEQNAGRGDLIIFYASFGETVFNYYARRSDLIHLPFPAHGYDIETNDLSQLESQIRFHNDSWLILTHARDAEILLDFLQERLQQNKEEKFISYGVNSHKPYTGITIYHFMKKAL